MKFKTNIRCNNCIANVRPKLDAVPGIKEWSVDLSSPDRILTIEGDNLDEKMITEAISSAGYQAVKLS